MYCIIVFVLYYCLCIVLLALHCIICYWLYIVLFIISIILALYCIIGFILYYLLLALYCIICYWLYIVLFITSCILYHLLFIIITSISVLYQYKSVEFWSRLSCFLNPKATFFCHITDANYLQDFEVKVSLKGSDCCLCAKYRDKYDIIPLSQITLLCDQPILGDEVKVYRPEHARFRADAISFAEIKIITT